MSKLSVVVTEESLHSRHEGLSYLGHKTTHEFDEVGSLEALGEAFLRVAKSMGFIYVESVEFETKGRKQEAKQ